MAARYWDNKEIPGRGTKFCLVMDPEDGTNPIRTYGWSKDEVLDKVSTTALAAQATINRQRAAQPATPTNGNGNGNSPKPVTPAPVVTKTLTPDEQMQATVDLSNPAKSREALKTLLGAEGLDLDKIKLDQQIRRVAAIGQEWEKLHPDFPADERNSRLLLDKAALMVGFANITAETLDRAFAELQRYGMLFDAEEPQEQEPAPQPATPPNGSSDSRVTRPRTATSYRATALRTPAPGARREPKYTRAEIDAMNSKQLRDKIEHEPGFAEWYNRELSASA